MKVTYLNLLEVSQKHCKIKMLLERVSSVMITLPFNNDLCAAMFWGNSPKTPLRCCYSISPHDAIYFLMSTSLLPSKTPHSMISTTPGLPVGLLFIILKASLFFFPPYILLVIMVKLLTFCFNWLENTSVKGLWSLANFNLAFYTGHGVALLYAWQFFMLWRYRILDENRWNRRVYILHQLLFCCLGVPFKLTEQCLFITGLFVALSWMKWHWCCVYVVPRILSLHTNV